MKKLISIFIVFLLPSLTFGQWKKVKKMLNPNTKIVLETENRLKIKLNQATLSMLISQNSDDQEADIAVRFEQHMSSNPYKVYFITEKLRNDKSKPKNIWGKFFKIRFLSILRKK